QAFKVGINRPRSRGDREEVFGGMGESWKGAFVGGDLLVHAVTYGPDGDDERLLGNFPDYSHFPSRGTAPPPRRRSVVVGQWPDGSREPGGCDHHARRTA